MVAAAPASSATRQFGRFELRHMLGRSHASSTWLAWDPRVQEEVLLCVPRGRPSTNEARDTWAQDALLASRLKHPCLRQVIEIGSHDGWPFMSCERQGGITLVERLQQGGAPAVWEVATWLADVVDGLAYAHEAGVPHLDIGLHNVLVDASGRAHLFGLGVGVVAPATGGAHAQEPFTRSQVRACAERDLLMCGLLAYRLLSGQSALDDSDLGSAAGRVGLEIVRLPWTTPHPVPETLRAIINRATDRQQRQRYLNARTLLSALQGWLKTNAVDTAGPLALLLDRLNTAGTLPSRPGADRAMLNAVNQDALRVDDLVDVMTRNPAIAFEMLRVVNGSSKRSGKAEDEVTTLGRSVLLLGQAGMRRVAASVRTWPGVLGAQTSLHGNSQAEGALEAALRQSALAGCLSRLLVPLQFRVSDEEAYLLASAQKLGWLLVLYHLPDEASQITKLMQAGPPSEGSITPTPGMSMDAAASAVLGINLDDLTAAVLKHWGVGERLIQGARPFARNAPVRRPSGQEEALRAVASLSNELADALLIPGGRGVTAMQQAVVRYARALDLTLKECQLAIERALELVDEGLQVEAPITRF